MPILTWSPERKAEIERRQQIALHEWTCRIKAEIQNALATQKPLSDLTELRQQAQQVLKLSPEADDKDILQEMLYRMEVERFKQAQTALQAQDLATAEMLNKEIKQDSDSLYAKADVLALPFSEQRSAGETRSLWRQTSNLEVQITILKDEQRHKQEAEEQRKIQTELGAAREVLANGNLDAAAQSLRNVLHLSPKHPEALDLQAHFERTSQFRRQLDQAEAEFKKVIIQKRKRGFSLF